LIVHLVLEEILGLGLRLGNFKPPLQA